MANDNFFGDVPFGETSDGEIMRDEITLDGTLDGLKDVSNANLEEDGPNKRDKSTLSINQSNLGICLLVLFSWFLIMVEHPILLKIMAGSPLLY